KRTACSSLSSYRAGLKLKCESRVRMLKFGPSACPMESISDSYLIASQSVDPNYPLRHRCRRSASNRSRQSVSCRQTPRHCLYEPCSSGIATFGLRSGVELADPPLRKLFLLTSEAAEHRGPFDDMTIHRLEYLGASRIRS